MKQTKVFHRVAGTLLAIVTLACGSWANADPVTQLIHFDDANNGWKWYSDVDNSGVAKKCRQIPQVRQSRTKVS